MTYQRKTWRKDYVGELLSRRDMTEKQLREHKTDIPIIQFRYVEGILEGLNQAINLLP